jgi:hypothetical protein
MVLLQSVWVLKSAEGKLRHKGELQSPPPNDDYISYLRAGLKASRVKESGTGIPTNIMRISFVSRNEKDGRAVLDALIEAYADWYRYEFIGETDETLGLIVNGLKNSEDKLAINQEDIERVQHERLSVSHESADDLKTRISANEKTFAALMNERFDLQFNVDLLEKAVKDGKDKSVILYYLKFINDLTVPDDRAKAEGLKQKTDELFKIYLESAKEKIKSKQLHIDHIQHLLDDDRVTLLKIDAFTDKETRIRQAGEKLRQTFDEFIKRKHEYDSDRDVPLFRIRVIAQPTTVRLNWPLL